MNWPSVPHQPECRMLSFQPADAMLQALVLQHPGWPACFFKQLFLGHLLGSSSAFECPLFLLMKVIWLLRTSSCSAPARGRQPSCWCCCLNIDDSATPPLGAVGFADQYTPLKTNMSHVVLKGSISIVNALSNH